MPAEVEYSLAIASDDYARLRQVLFTADLCENFAALFCGVVTAPHTKRFLVREIASTPASVYRERRQDHLEIAPAFLNSVVERALVTGLTPVLVHSHPQSSNARYSMSDDYGESRLLPVLRQLLPGHHPASLLVSCEGMVGRVYDRKRFIPFESVEIRGVGGARYRDRPKPEVAGASLEFDRSIRAIGLGGHATIAALKVGVVGLGGTGSAVALELAHLGVSDLVLIDPDRLEASNLPRVWGSDRAAAERGDHKVDMVGKTIRRLRAKARINRLRESVIRQSVLMQLRDRDVLFACTDNHLSRAILNRFAHQYLVPVVDMGIRLDARSGSVTAAAGRVSLVGAGLTCLRCSGHIDPDRIRAESTPLAEREALAQEGYIQGLPDPEPAVISLNTTVASMAVTAGLGLFVNLVGHAPDTDLIYDSTNTTAFAVVARHQDSCDVCTAANGLRGLGDLQVVSAYN